MQVLLLAIYAQRYYALKYRSRPELGVSSDQWLTVSQLQRSPPTSHSLPMPSLLSSLTPSKLVGFASSSSASVAYPQFVSHWSDCHKTLRCLSFYCPIGRRLFLFPLYPLPLNSRFWLLVFLGALPLLVFPTPCS
jgi:hypothetical protein